MHISNSIYFYKYIIQVVVITIKRKALIGIIIKQVEYTYQFQVTKKQKSDGWCWTTHDSCEYEIPIKTQTNQILSFL